MVTQGGNTAQDLSTEHRVEEPSMEEILASIKRIIADEETTKDGLSERERYTHPDNPSNSNSQFAVPPRAQSAVPLRDPDLDDADMQAALEAEMAASLPEISRNILPTRAAAEELAAPERVIPSQEIRPEPVRESVFEAAEKRSGGRESIEEKAAKLRARLSSGSVDITADERLAQYRAQGKLHLEALAAHRIAVEKEAAAKRAARAEEEKAQAEAREKAAAEAEMKARADEQVKREAEDRRREEEKARAEANRKAAAAFNGEQNRFRQGAAEAAADIVLPSTSAIAAEMAASMLREKQGELQSMVAEMMRPTIRKWLSDNLPSMVEKLVREEIEAVSRGKKTG